MNKSTREYLDGIKVGAKAISVTMQSWWRQAGSRDRRIAVSAGVAICMCGIYAMSKGEDAVNGKVLISREAEFKKSRILGDPYATSGLAKEQALNKTAKEYSEGQKLLMDGLAQINSRIELIEGKIASGGSDKDQTGNEGREGTTASIDQGIQGLNAEPSQGTTSSEVAPFATGSSTNEPIDMRPAIPRGRIEISGYDNADGPERPFRAAKGPPIIAFPVQGVLQKDRAEVVLPVGSYVKAKLLTGVEAPEGNPYPVLLQLDFTNILPNKKSLDLRGCFMIAKAQGDLSTERVQMQATKLSCVSRKGQMFERDINGFVADAVDNSFAVIGTVNTKQDRVAAMAFLSSVVEGVGRAIQMAQTTEQTSAEGVSRKSLTGDQGKYIAAGGAGAAAGMVAQWYLKQAQNLLPTINVGSGQDVWIVMNESVALPHEYFKKVSMGEKHEKDYSLVNRLFD